MSLRLDNYNLNRVEWCYSIATVSGLPLAKRHWEASHSASTQALKWGHRIIAIIEACPILGAVVALIEIIIAKVFKSNRPSRITPPPIVWDGKAPLEFNQPFLLTTDQLKLIGMPPNLRFSALPEYADSIFRVTWKGFSPLAKIVRIKNEATINGKLLQFPVLKGPERGYEGQRVRTFSLELLSNLEDRLTLHADTRKMEELIQCVKYFIENFAFDKKAGFVDYNEFLSILMKEASECEHIFLRHRNFIDVQQSLPKSIHPKNSSWEKLRIIIRSGLFTPNLSEGASKALQCGLHPLPQVPVKKRIFNLYPMIDAINTLANDYREAGRWLMHKTRLFTFRELCNSIKKSCMSLNEEILSWKNYTILTIPGKSQAWMAKLAYRYLPIEKLAGVSKLPQRRTGDEIYRLMTQSSSDNFLIFDDGAYSCTQFDRYLDEFTDAITDAINDKEAFVTTKNLYFVFGYFPKSEYERFSKQLKFCKDHNVNVKIITNNFTSSWKNDDKSDLMKKASELSTKCKMEIVTEWKRPDFYSTSLFITEGYQCQFSRSDLGELNADIRRVESMNGEGPIANDATPYLSESH